MTALKITTTILFSMLLCACNSGPNYKPPAVEVPEHYKEAPKGWKVAQPKDDCDRGNWWVVFGDPILNSLEDELQISNQNIKLAIAQYSQATALVKGGRAAYFPTIGAAGSAIRGKPSTPSVLSTKPSTHYLAQLSAGWEPDLFGTVRRTVEANSAAASASKAQLGLVRLSMQANLAQYYFQLRTTDLDQRLLNDTVKSYQEALKLTRVRYQEGIISELDILQAETQLKTAEAQAEDNLIWRSQLEHAIAVLIGKPPSCFALAKAIGPLKPPSVPMELPCDLLERRPDIAQTERLVKQANANVGVAVAAFFPTLTFSSAGGYDNTILRRLFTTPPSFWSLGSQLAGTIFDGGLRSATKNAAWAIYHQTVATYRQTVLTAFQEVEDNLVALKRLSKEIALQQQVVRHASKALDITLKQYKVGTVSYTDVIIAQNTLYSAKRNETDTRGRQMLSTVLLIKALGGGWS
jgi:NodT family efflux transporter outer membrane factor (OMF) lipoprotein